MHKKETCRGVEGPRASPGVLQLSGGNRWRAAGYSLLLQPSSFKEDKFEGNAEGDTPLVPWSLTLGTTPGRICLMKSQRHLSLKAFVSVNTIQVHDQRQCNSVTSVQISAMCKGFVLLCWIQEISPRCGDAVQIFSPNCCNQRKKNTHKKRPFSLNKETQQN